MVRARVTAPEAKKERMPPRLGRYDVRAKIGEGGMATVYVGREAGDAGGRGGQHGVRVVALKVIKEEYSLNREFVNMFLDEAKIVSKLKHPNLIDVHELGNEGSRLFIAMELLAGQSLWHLWMACRDRNVRLRYDMIAWLGARIAEGLHHAHELEDEKGEPLGVVHRDVNASNIFVTYGGQVKVIDFGLAKAANRVSKTAAGVVKGKFAYMSPEQALGKPLDRRTDVFALAATLWELTVDRRLFKGKDDFETLRKVSQAAVRDPATLVEGYPPALWHIFKRALQRDRTRRYATALELAAALDKFATSEGRVIDERAMAAVMRDLFAHERQRDATWLAEASAADRPAPTESLKPAPADETGPKAAIDAATLPPPPRVPSDRAPSALPLTTGLFAPAPVRPPNPPPEEPLDPALAADDAEDPRADSAPRFSIKRALLFGGATVILLLFAMLVGAWWGLR